MTKGLDEFREAFRISELTVMTLDHWTWSVRPVHSTLGASVFSLNRECRSVGDLEADEAAELPSLWRHFERRVEALFSAKRFNYLCLMMFDDQVHFHAFPRYIAPQDQFGRIWTDSTWPQLPAIGEGPDLTSSRVLHDIGAALRQGEL